VIEEDRYEEEVADSYLFLNIENFEEVDFEIESNNQDFDKDLKE
jgi:hypothetical protein